MLKGIDPLLTPELLWALAAMGHGDDLALVDALHPGEAMAKKTVSGKLIRLAGVDIVRAARAILTVFPLDGFVADPVRRMEVVGNPADVPPVQALVQKEVDAAAGRHLSMAGLERFAFYSAESHAFAVVQTGDTRPYGCFLLRKGILPA
jgi:L-fucose mutarotase